MLELRNITRHEGNVRFLEDVSLTLQRGELNILLGPTLSGKTSLMRIMAGLDKPDSGELLFDGDSVLGTAVQKRNVAMVYQQFINYPSLTVFENIASPLRVARVQQSEIDERVAQVAELLQLTDMLDRAPNTLSGGQQQRVAIARALIKRADLVLLDEPLANLDYKLREELRTELPELFAAMGAVLVYATTEPTEALVLGGNTACLHEGRIEQFGPTLEMYRGPTSLRCAKIFSDPPLNSVEVICAKGEVSLAISGRQLEFNSAQLADGSYTMAVRPHHLNRQRGASDEIELGGDVSVTELTGSETFVHFSLEDNFWVALLHDVEEFAVGSAVSFFIKPQHILFFDGEGEFIDWQPDKHK
ncbi:MAG: ABC transporter ATP-binding protein [Pseudohongiella sp.]|nr:MAG: ABC transporter ATP-binding protein [Pseudohongiella sp.]